jgi:ADP-ribosylglycohydrolase
MIGAIIGDIVGSVYEFNNIATEDFSLFSRKSTFTDDTVLTVATADTILDKAQYSQYYLDYAQAFPNRGWGGNFQKMVRTGKLTPYNSYGNGSAMRVSPVGWVYDTYEQTLEEAQKSAECTHSHSEGIKGAQAIAASVWLARTGKGKDDIAGAIKKLGYEILPLSEFGRTFDESCQGTIPKCMAIFLNTNDYEGAIKKSIAMGGDVDTIACIVGGIAQAFYGMPSREIVEEAYVRLPKHLAKVTTAFTQKYIDPNFVEPQIVGTDGAAYL